MPIGRLIVLVDLFYTSPGAEKREKGEKRKEKGKRERKRGE
jgi:hypothetical protein